MTAEYATAAALADACAVEYAALAAFADEYAADADRATVAAFAAAARSDVYAADYTAAAAAATAGAAAAAAKALDAWRAYIAAAAAAQAAFRADVINGAAMTEQGRRLMLADTAWTIQRQRINTYMQLERQGKTAQAAEVEATIGESDDDLRRIVGPAATAYIAAVSTQMSTDMAAQVAYRLAFNIANSNDLVKHETWNQDDKRNGVT